MRFQVKPGNALGRLGEGFGHGLAQQLPKEIERGRLAAGLRNLGQQDFSQLSPLEIQAQLAQIPGMTPEMMSLAYQNLRNQFQAGGPGQSRQFNANQSPASPGIKKAQPRVETELEDQEIPRLTEQSSNYGIPKDDRELHEEAQASYHANPNRFTEFNDYLQFAAQQDAKRVQKEQLFESRQREVDGMIDKGIQEITQKPGFNAFKDTPSDAVYRFKTKAKNLVNKGLTPQQAYQKIEEEVKPFIKARNSVAENTSIFKALKTSSGEVLRRLNSARETYKKSGNLNIFKSDLESQGISSPYANEIAYPISDNKEITALIKNAPKSKSMGQNATQIEQLAKEIAPLIGPRDSPQSIALALFPKGYNPTDIVKALDELAKEGIWIPGPYQQEDLEGESDYKPTLKDISIVGRKRLDPLSFAPRFK